MMHKDSSCEDLGALEAWSLFPRLEAQLIQSQKGFWSKIIQYCPERALMEQRILEKAQQCRDNCFLMHQSHRPTECLLLTLPQDVLLNILGRLECPVELARVTLTCSLLYVVASDNLLWKRMYMCWHGFNWHQQQHYHHHIQLINKAATTSHSTLSQASNEKTSNTLPSSSASLPTKQQLLLRKSSNGRDGDEVHQKIRSSGSAEFNMKRKMSLPSLYNSSPAIPCFSSKNTSIDEANNSFEDEGGINTLSNDKAATPADQHQPQNRDEMASLIAEKRREAKEEKRDNQYWKHCFAEMEQKHLNYKKASISERQRMLFTSTLQRQGSSLSYFQAAVFVLPARWICARQRRQHMRSVIVNKFQGKDRLISLRMEGMIETPHLVPTGDYLLPPGEDWLIFGTMKDLTTSCSSFSSSLPNYEPLLRVLFSVKGHVTEVQEQICIANQVRSSIYSPIRYIYQSVLLSISSFLSLSSSSL